MNFMQTFWTFPFNKIISLLKISQQNHNANKNIKHFYLLSSQFSPYPSICFPHLHGIYHLYFSTFSIFPSPTVEFFMAPSNQWVFYPHRIYAQISFSQKFILIHSSHYFCDYTFETRAVSQRNQCYLRYS